MASRPSRHNDRNRAGGRPAVGDQPTAHRDRQSGPDLPRPDAEGLNAAMGFIDFDPPEDRLPDHANPMAVAEPQRQPRRDEFYDTPIVDGKPVPNTLLTRLRDQLRALLM